MLNFSNSTGFRIDPLKPVEQQILSIIGINPKTGSILKPVELEKLSINIS